MKIRSKIVITLSVIFSITILLAGILIGGKFLLYYNSRSGMRKVESLESKLRQFLFSKKIFLKKLPKNIVTRVDFGPQRNHELRNIKGIQEEWGEFEIFILFPQKDLIIHASYEINLNLNWQPKEIFRERVVVLFTKPKKTFESMGHKMRSYHGISINESALGEYIKELKEDGDISTIRKLLREKDLYEQDVYNDITDPIHVMLSK